MRCLVIPWVGLGLCLTACGQTADSDLQQWFRDQRASVKPKIQTTPPPKLFAPQAFDAVGMDPFGTERQLAVYRVGDLGLSTPAAPSRADPGRHLEPLERVPLESVRMVGTLARSGQLVALVRASGALYVVRPGHRIGPNSGRVVRITEAEITLREMAQDPTGAWIERVAVIALDEDVKP